MEQYQVPFTQYIRPHGRTREVTLQCLTEEAFLKSQTILSSGLKFECEILTTGESSLTIADREKEEDLAIEVSPAGYGDTCQALENLILNFSLESKP